jgi:hypothetical protein
MLLTLMTSLTGELIGSVNSAKYLIGLPGTLLITFCGTSRVKMSLGSFAQYLKIRQITLPSTFVLSSSAKTILRSQYPGLRTTIFRKLLCVPDATKRPTG